MPLPNPRINKLKNAISKLHQQDNDKEKAENENVPQPAKPNRIMSPVRNNHEVNRVYTTNNNTDKSHTTNIASKPLDELDLSITTGENEAEKKQQKAETNSLDDKNWHGEYVSESLAIHMQRRSTSTEDFSPASDDDREYEPESKRKPNRVIPSSSSSSSESTSSSNDSSSSDSDTSSTDDDIKSAAAKRPRRQSLESTTSTMQPVNSLMSDLQLNLESLEEDSTVGKLASDQSSNAHINEVYCNIILTETIDHAPPRKPAPSPISNEESNLPTTSLQTQTYEEGEELVTVIVVAEDVSSESPICARNPSSLRMIALQSLNKALTLLPTSHTRVTPVGFLNPSSTAKSRKRLRRGSKKLTAKILRNLGYEYTSQSGKHSHVDARSIKSPCNDKCKHKCSAKINENYRKLIFDNYWRTGLLSNQRDFIASHTVDVIPKYQYKRVDSNRKHKQAFYLSVDGTKHRVCKLFFKNTLGINDRVIRTVLDKKQSTGILEPERRGKHGRENRIPERLLKGVRDHINSIPRIESHYLRQQSTREYIEGGKTVTNLYDDYKKDCIQNDTEFVKIHTYRKVFNEEFNIGFYIPKKDQCDTCASYQNRSIEEKLEIEEAYNNHLKEKAKSREEKERDKLSVSRTKVVACYDLQAVMPVPKGEVSVFYYKSKLNCFNFTISELKSDHTECFFWNEVEAHRGANEIGTCVFKYLEKKSRASTDPFDMIFYSDNCCGQQKNQFVISMYIFALKRFDNLSSITHKYLITGHTQNEGDAVHSTIEKQIKRMKLSGPIYVPDQYITAIKEAKKNGNKYIVNEMGYSDFYDIKKLKEYQFNKNTEGGQVKISEIKILKFFKEESHPNRIRMFYKTSYMENDFKEIKLRKFSRANPQLKNLYSARLPLAPNKKTDIQSLIKNRHIPAYYASSFYNSIL